MTKINKQRIYSTNAPKRLTELDKAQRDKEAARQLAKDKKLNKLSAAQPIQSLLVVGPRVGRGGALPVRHHRPVQLLVLGQGHGDLNLVPARLA